MTWNMANYLPEEGNIRGNFTRVVVGYISAVNNFLEKEKERVAPGISLKYFTYIHTYCILHIYHLI